MDEDGRERAPRQARGRHSRRQTNRLGRDRVGFLLTTRVGSCSKNFVSLRGSPSNTVRLWMMPRSWPRRLAVRSIKFRVLASCGRPRTNTQTASDNGGISSCAERSERARSARCSTHTICGWITRVALKLLRPEIAKSDFSARILHEARRLARVRHPNVVNVHGADMHDGRIGFWMDLIEGETLTDLLSRGPLSPGETTHIGQELCLALAAVHGANLIHRDVKAQNVMRASNGGRIILMDFGAGEFIDRPSTGSMRGTPLYLAPELFDGARASVATDIYACGVLLYHLVTGRFPVNGSSIEALAEAHRRGDRRRLLDEHPDLPVSFTDLVERAIDPEPGKRFPSAGAMHKALGGDDGPTEHPHDETEDRPGSHRGDGDALDNRGYGFTRVQGFRVGASCGSRFLGRADRLLRRWPPRASAICSCVDSSGCRRRRARRATARDMATPGRHSPTIVFTGRTT